MRFLQYILLLCFVAPALLDIAQAGESVSPRLSLTEEEAKVMAFSPDGRLVVISGAGGTRLMDADTGQVRAVLTAAPHQVHGPVFSPDGRLLFAKVGSDEFEPVHVFDLKVWDVATGREHASFPYIADGINASTEHFALSPDGKMLAFLDNSERLPMVVKTSKMIIDGRSEVETAFNGNPGLPKVKLWDVEQWREAAVLEGGSHMVFAPDGATLVTGSRDWKVPVAKVWDTATGELRAELAGEAQWVKPMTFSPDGTLLAIGGRGDETLWEITDRKRWLVPISLGGSRSPVFSPDGALLFPNGLPRGYPASNMNNEFPCYDVSVLPPRRLELGEGQRVVQPLTYNEPRLLISLPTMRYASFSEADEEDRRTVVLRDLPSTREIGRYVVAGLIDSDFSPDGRWLVTWAGRRLRLLDPETGQVVVTIPTPDEVWGDARWTFSPDGRTLAVTYVEGAGSEPGIGERPRTVALWDLPPG